MLFLFIDVSTCMIAPVVWVVWNSVRCCQYCA